MNNNRSITGKCVHIDTANNAVDIVVGKDYYVVKVSEPVGSVWDKQCTLDLEDIELIDTDENGNLYTARSLSEDIAGLSAKTIDVTIAVKIPAFVGEDYTRFSENILEHIENENDYYHQEGILPEGVEVTAETIHVAYPE